MSLEIQSRSDFKTGSELVVSIPESELDCKALYTILADCPNFILPFRHRSIDGQIELTYQIGHRTKLNYLAGNRAPADYAKLWFNLLQPLLDCDDWFMNPHCFVLQVDHLYCDKATMNISYVYIPTLQPVSDQDMLKGMITEVARRNRVTDTAFENKVVWAIQDFNIQDFLQIIKPFRSGSIPNNVLAQAAVAPNLPVVPPPTPGSALPPATGSAPPPAPGFAPSPVPGFSPAASPQVSSRRDVGKQKPAVQNPLDIMIQLPNNGKTPNDGKSRGGLFKKKEKVEKPPREKKGFAGKNNNQIMQGAASQPVYPGPSPSSAPAAPAAPIYPPFDQEDGETQIDPVVETANPHFRYVGVGVHPATIEVPMQVGELFTIGRFDVSVGAKQSSFEFEGHTKAVSRRHAAVERSATGYSIVDLDSSAGTFLNGQKLPPNAPFALERGCRISFGNDGADYIWEAGHDC